MTHKFLKIFGDNHINIAALLARVGMMYGNRDNKGRAMIGQTEEHDKHMAQQKAKDLLKRAYDIREGKLGRDHPLTKGLLFFWWQR